LVLADPMRYREKATVLTARIRRLVEEELG